MIFRYILMKHTLILQSIFSSTKILNFYGSGGSSPRFEPAPPRALSQLAVPRPSASHLESFLVQTRCELPNLVMTNIAIEI